MNSTVIMNGTSTGGVEYLVGTHEGATSTGVPSELTATGRAAKRSLAGGSNADDKARVAVYSYLQAVRALGHTHIDIREIARSLSLSQDVVSRALEELASKGVKVIRPR